MDNPTKENLLAGIKLDMRLDKAFFLKIYGYEISYPGFMEIAIKSLEDAGCSKAKAYYESIVADYEKSKNEELKPVAKWLVEKIDREFEQLCKLNKGGEEKRKQELLERRKILLMQLKER